MKDSASLQSGRPRKTNTTDPVSMLKQDHNKVKDLFDQFEDTDDRQTQMEIASQALQELKIHAAIEEEIFYPAARKVIEDREIMQEALEEHHVAHMLIDEIDEGDLDPETFHAKFKVLAESVRHHIKEEEGKMLPKIDSDETNMEQLGARMALRKEELMENPDELETGEGKSRSTARSAKTSSQGPRSGGRGGGKHRQPSPR